MLPGLLLLAGEFVALAAVGFVVARVALGQRDDLAALAQGMVIGLALWGLAVNFVSYLWPGYASALAAWVVIAAVGAHMAWRGRVDVRTSGRATTGCLVAFLALFWIALAGRQLLPNPDPYIHHGFIGGIRAGWAHPPELPWNPGLAVPYHYAVDLLIGLLTPPIGPDPAFVTELVGAYLWTSYALIVGTLLLRRGSWLAAVTLGPLLLAAGTQTLLFASPGVLQVPIPAGLPAPGLRASLTTVYVDGLVASESVPPNVWKPSFPLAYALALVVLERAAHVQPRRWPRQATLALMVGFLGLVDEAVAPIVLALWVVLEVVTLVRARREGLAIKSTWGAATGPALAVLLLAVGGGVLSAVLTGGEVSALSIGWIGDTSLRQPLVSFSELAGGLGLLSLGPVILAGGAALLAGRDRLTIVLVAAAGAFVVAALLVRYEFGQQDVSRLDGYARNFALLAVLFALSLRMRELRTRWRLAVGALVVGLVTWPAVVSPLRALGPALSQGVQLANATWETDGVKSRRRGQRSVYPSFRSERLAEYIRSHTGSDARILSPNPAGLSAVTGRPSAAGFIQASHLLHEVGPEYTDATRYLDPAAVERLGIAYVHATDAWVLGLPDRAKRWLNDPLLFQPLARDGADALYRVRPEFLKLVTVSEPESYEALRRAVPSSAVVYVDPAIESPFALRLASALAHARLVGEIYPGNLHLRTDFGIQPLGEHHPSFVVVPHTFTPSMLSPAARRPIWWNAGLAVYATDAAAEPVMIVSTAKLPPVSVRASDDGTVKAGIGFGIELINRAADRWTGQDWLVVPANASGLPVSADSGGADGGQWFPGQFAPGQERTRLNFILDPGTTSLSMREIDGGVSAVGKQAAPLDAGYWTVALRLAGRVDHGSYVAHEQVAFVPVMLIRVSADGDVTYGVFEGDLAARLGDRP